MMLVKRPLEQLKILYKGCQGKVVSNRGLIRSLVAIFNRATMIFGEKTMVQIFPDIAGCCAKHVGDIHYHHESYMNRVSVSGFLMPLDCTMGRESGSRGIRNFGHSG